MTKVVPSPIMPCTSEKSMKQYPEIITSRKLLTEMSRQYRKAGKIIVFTNGCFDIVHAGHIAYLEKASQLGDVLMVGMNTDSSIKQYKGDKRPINPLADRIKVLAALKMINHIIPFAERTPERLLSIIRPNFDVKGGDYTAETLPEAPIVRQYGGKVVIIPLFAHHSTTTIIRKVVDTYGEK